SSCPCRRVGSPARPRESSPSSITCRADPGRSRRQQMSNRCAIVTGGAGFIGSHVVDALLADDWRVVVVDDLSTGDAARVADEATLGAVDITNRSALEAVVDAARPA